MRLSLQMKKAGLANTAATNADNARLAIQDDLALKADQADLVQLAGEVSPFWMLFREQNKRHRKRSFDCKSESIRTIKRVRGHRIVAQKCSERGMSVKLEGLTAENLL